MWDYTNFENQRAHLENAGLSVGLMYGNGGAGGASTSGGQGSGPGNPGTQAVGIGLQAKALELQNKQIESQIAVNMATAEKTASEAKKIAGVSLLKIDLVNSLLFFFSLAISSEISTADSSCTNRNSSILLVNSAMGCSKSKKTGFIKQSSR